MHRRLAQTSPSQHKAFLRQAISFPNQQKTQSHTQKDPRTDPSTFSHNQSTHLCTMSSNDQSPRISRMATPEPRSPDVSSVSLAIPATRGSHSGGKTKPISARRVSRNPGGFNLAPPDPIFGPGIRGASTIAANSSLVPVSIGAKATDMVPKTSSALIVSSYKMHHVVVSDKHLFKKLLPKVREQVLKCVQQQFKDHAFKKLSGDTVVPINHVDLEGKFYLVSIVKKTTCNRPAPGDIVHDRNVLIVRAAKDVSPLSKFPTRPGEIQDPGHLANYLQENSSAWANGEAEFHCLVFFSNTCRQNLNQPSQIVMLSGEERKSFRAALDVFLANAVSLTVEDSVICGKKVFSPQATQLFAGLELRSGHTGQLVFDIGSEASVSHTMSEGCFLQPILVSEFLLQHCGAVVTTGKSGDGAFERAEKALIGVKISVAMPSKTNHRIYTIQSLRGSVRDHPQSKCGTVAAATDYTVQYPDMVCVNVKSTDSPFYFPAEVCKILPDQPFNGQAPVSSACKAFETQAKKSKDAFDPNPALFSAADDKLFRFIFVEATMPNHGQPVSSLDQAAWTSFKDQLGERFNRKLQEAVQQAQNFVVDFSSASSPWSEQLRTVVAGASGVQNVLIVAVPKQLPTTTVNEVRLFCDVDFGIQCHIVSANEINKRLKGPKVANLEGDKVSEAMVKYSGAQVRKIFARSMYPGAPEFITQDLSTNASTGQNLLIGAHVVSLQDIIDPKHLQDKSLSIDDNYLITVVSTSNDEELDQQAKPLHRRRNAVTSHRIFIANEPSQPRVPAGEERQLPPASLLSQVREQVMRHIVDLRMADIKQGLLQKEWANIAIYQSGIGVKDVDALKAQLQDMQENVQFEDNSHNVIPSMSLTSMTPETILPLSAKQDSLWIDGTHGEFPGLGLEPILEPTYRRLPGSDQAPATPWHIFRSVLPAGTFKDQQPFSVELARMPLPDILYLAQQASKRAQLRVSDLKKSEDGLPKDNSTVSRLPYDVLDVHSALKNTLYFL